MALGTGNDFGPVVITVALIVGEVVTLALAKALTAHGTTGSIHDAARLITLRRSSPFAANTVLALAYNRLDVVVVAALTSVSEYSKYAPASRIRLQSQAPFSPCCLKSWGAAAKAGIATIRSAL
jgi:O-antigen/teichoic acid export membrane protein